MRGSHEITNKVANFIRQHEFKRVDPALLTSSVFLKILFTFIDPFS